MLTCRDVTEDFLAVYVDGTLSPILFEEVRAHLRVCQVCVAYLQTYRKSRDLFKQANQLQMPDEMKAIFRRFLRTHLPNQNSWPRLGGLMANFQAWCRSG